jgi:hypothetical protein
MANREYRVRAWKVGQAGSVVLRVSAADARAAQAAAESSGWTVEGVEEDLTGSPRPLEPATLESLQAELRDLRANVDLLQRSPIIRHPYQTIFWATVLTFVIFTVVAMFLNACGHTR